MVYRAYIFEGKKLKEGLEAFNLKALLDEIQRNEDYFSGLLTKGNHMVLEYTEEQECICPKKV